MLPVKRKLECLHRQQKVTINLTFVSLVVIIFAIATLWSNLLKNKK